MTSYFQVDNVVRLDNWINLKMDPVLASEIVALRPSLESLVVRASKEPEQVLEFNPLDVKVRINNKIWHKISNRSIFHRFLPS